MPRNMQQPSPLLNNSQPFQQPYPPAQNSGRETAIDPALATEGLRDSSQEQGYKDALKAWARFRFVRAGWFTPAEAIAYIA